MLQFPYLPNRNESFYSVLCTRTICVKVCKMFRPGSGNQCFLHFLLCGGVITWDYIIFRITVGLNMKKYAKLNAWGNQWRPSAAPAFDNPQDAEMHLGGGSMWHFWFCGSSDIVLLGSFKWNSKLILKHIGFQQSA